MSNRRAAIIDLGTNTFNLLIVEATEDGWKSIYTTKVGVGLGLGGINESRLADDAMDRGVQTLREYQKKCRELDADQIQLFATSAIRNASNREVFLNRVQDELGLTIEVVSGEREAQLIYDGVSSGYDFSQVGLIMDIGGGSTEFILADSNGPIKARSFEIGVSRIYQLFDYSDPLTQEDEQKIEAYLKEKTGTFFDDMKVTELIGASGSFETFYELSTRSKFPDQEYVQLEVDHMMRSLEHIIESTQAERDQNDWIIPIRKKMAPIAAIKIRWIIQKLGITHVTISPFSLKEGVIKNLK